jgi:ribosomal protein S18 acetylase RimI-like enzyme
MTAGAAPLIRPLSRADAAAFRTLRTEALHLEPGAFGTSVAEWDSLTEDEILQRLPDNPPSATFGAFDGASLVGIAGLMAWPAVKQRHKGLIWGVYITPAQRGRGLAAALVDRIIADARASGRLEILQLVVTVGNTAARALYLSRGFVPYGLERRALKLGPDDYRDEELMALDLGCRTGGGN